MGPALYAMYENGIAYQFIPGTTLTTESCRRPEIYPAVAREMGRLHSIPLQDYPLADGDHSIIWDKIETFIQLGDEILKTNSEIREK